MKCTTLLSPVILLSVILTGCAGDSNSPSETVLASGTTEEQSMGSDSTDSNVADDDSTVPSTDDDQSSTSDESVTDEGTDTPTDETSDGSGSDSSENSDDGTDSGTSEPDDSEESDSDEDSSTEAAEPETTTTTQTYSRAYGEHTITINITTTEYHQNDPNLPSYRIWNYRNPATLGFESSAQKVYFYDQFSDADEEAYGQDNIEGFILSPYKKKVTFTHSEHSTVSSNDFLKVTSESISESGETEIKGAYHNSIDSQTFSDGSLIAEKILNIVNLYYYELCQDEVVSEGELGRYISEGFWQPGDKLTTVWDAHAPIYNCIDGTPEFLGYSSTITTAVTELVGSLNQVTIQGRSFNSLLKFASSETTVSQDTGNTVIENTGFAYNQLHTGLVAEEGTDCIIGESGTRYCSDEQTVATNLPTTPEL